jgi:hypothetical protein
VLAVLFLVASLIALTEVAKTPRAFQNATGSSQSIQTIRRFYAALNEYMETGDANAVSEDLASAALAFVPEAGAMGDESGLLTYLLALRSTVPELRFAIDRIDVSGDIAIANVRRSAAAGSSSAAWPGEISQEIFRVQDGRIVQHWTTAPGSALLHPLARLSKRTEISDNHHLAIAELAFAPGQYASQPIAGPALIIVVQGRLSLIRDGSTQIVDIATGSALAPKPNELASVVSGQAISIAERQTFVWNRDSEVASAYLVTLVDDQRQSQALIPADQHLPPATINELLLMVTHHAATYGFVTIRPLEFDNRSIPAGMWDLKIAWAVLGPGASLPLAGEDEWAVAHIMSGAARRSAAGQHDSEIQTALTNDGDSPAVVLVTWLRATD